MTIQEKEEKALELKHKIRAKQSQINDLIQEVETRFSTLQEDVKCLNGDLTLRLLKDLE